MWYILRFSRPPPCAPLLQTKVIDPPRQYFTFSDSRPTVKSNTIFDKIILIALVKYSLEIEEHLDFTPVWADVMSNNNSSLFSSPRFPKRENFQSGRGVGKR